MCYLEGCEEIVASMNTDEHTHVLPDNKATKATHTVEKEERIHSPDLDVFFRSLGSIFITYITSSTLNNLLLSSVIQHRSGISLDYILCRNSLLQIFSSPMDMKERCKLFNRRYGKPNIEMQCTIWNLSYFNIINNQFQLESTYNHNMMMKMIISYICINGMHPFLGIDCDTAPNCQWSDHPQCRIRSIFEKLLANKDLYEINHYDFDYRGAWHMRERESNLLIDVNEMMQFLFIDQNSKRMDTEIFDAFRNDAFTLFAFRNECDYTYKIQFDVIHCNSDLNVVDSFKISLFGKKLHFGSFPMDNKKNKRLWSNIKNVLLGHTFVNVENWWIISIQSIDTSLDHVEHNKCYYLICGEVYGTYVDQKKGKVDVDHMYSKLLVWKSCFYSEEHPYGHE